MGDDLLKPETRRQLGAVLQKGFGRIAAAGDDFQRSGHASALHSLLRRETGLPVPRAFLTSMATGDASHLNEMADDYLSASSRGDGFQVNRITNELDGARFLGGLFGGAGGGGGNPLGGLGSIGGGAPARGCVDLAGNRNGANPACHMGSLGGMPGGGMHLDGGGSAGAEAGSGIWDAISSGYGAFVDGVQNAVLSAGENLQEAGEWASDQWDAAADSLSPLLAGDSEDGLTRSGEGTPPSIPRAPNQGSAFSGGFGPSPVERNPTDGGDAANGNGETIGSQPLNDVNDAGVFGNLRNLEGAVGDIQPGMINLDEGDSEIAQDMVSIGGMAGDIRGLARGNSRTPLQRMQKDAIAVNARMGVITQKYPPEMWLERTSLPLLEGRPELLNDMQNYTDLQVYMKFLDRTNGDMVRAEELTRRWLARNAPLRK